MKATVHERGMRAVPLGLALLAALAYAAISIDRHDHFASNAFDLGVQDQTIWGYSRLQIIPNTVEMIPNLLGDHFHPILMAVAPLYWIWDDARVLLVVQAALLAAAAYSHWTYEALGSGPASALVHLVRHPISSLQLLVDNPIKRKLWGGLLGAWLLLPLLSPISMVAIPTLLERLWSSNPALWSASFHYSLVIAPVLAFASIDGLARLQHRLSLPRWRGRVGVAVSLAVLAAGLILSFGVVRPLDELSTYISAGQAATIQSCLNTIPPDASVSASNRLLPHLSHRREIYLLTMKSDAEYIAIDLSTYLGQFFPGEEAQIRMIITQALANGYGVACSRGTTVVLHRS